MIYWFIGQPGCGKTTLAKRLASELRAKGSAVLHLDGDNLRKIFAVPYDKPENFTKEYRIEQTRALQRFVAHIADQGIDVIVSTVNPYRDVREEFKGSRNDVVEIHVFTGEIRGREKYHVPDFELPHGRCIEVLTGGTWDEEAAFRRLYASL